MRELIDIDGRLFNNRYRFTLIPIYHNECLKGSDASIKKQLCLIGIKDVIKNRIVVHRFSEYSLQWKNSSYSTMKNEAATVMRFLNYVINNNNDFKITSFSSLNSIHGSKYLNSLTYNGCSESYFNSEEKSLNRFYRFLFKKDLLDKLTFEEIEVLQDTESFFSEATKPTSKNNNRPPHSLEPELQLFFLETAMIYVPRIALGVYFGLFGGLRGSENVNITTNSISISGPYGEYGMMIGLRDRELRPDLKNYNGAHVKTPGIQQIDSCFDYLPILYKNHLENYIATDGSGALFANRDGKAMTSRSYRDYFNRVKKHLLRDLEESEYTYMYQSLLGLKGKKWSTHLCLRVPFRIYKFNIIKLFDKSGMFLIYLKPY